MKEKLRKNPENNPKSSGKRSMFAVNSRSRKITSAAMFLGISLIISLFENALPPILPALPYAKLGIANGVLIVAVAVMGIKWGAAISVARCLLTAVFGGNFFALAFSLPAALASLAVTWGLLSLKRNSLPAISAAAAIAHNAVQVAVGCAVAGSASLFSLLPYMCLFGGIAGVATGLVGIYIIKELF